MAVFGEFALMPLDELNVDVENYQRLVSDPMVRQIVEHYDPRLFQPIWVGLRPDNEYYVVDGQHRLVAAKELNMKSVPAMLFLSEGPEWEARYFVALQEKRRNLLAHQKFHAKVRAGDPESIEIKGVLEHRGFRVHREERADTAAKANNVISAIGSCEAIYRSGGTQLLDQVLMTIRQCWNGDRRAVGAPMLRGLAAFYQRYGGSPKFNAREFRERLKSYNPQDLQTRIAAVTKALNVSYATGALRAFIDVYNRQRREDHRLIE